MEQQGRNPGDELWLAIDQERPASLCNLIPALQAKCDQIIDEFNIARQACETKEQLYQAAKELVEKL